MQIKYTVLDAETTTHNKGHPFDPRNKLVSYAFKVSNTSGIEFRYWTDPSFNNRIQSDRLVGFNFKFDFHWCSHLLSSNIKIWDCQLAEHIYTGQKAQYISLDECLTKYGLETKKDIVKELWDSGVQTDEIPVDILEEYNCWDVQQTERLFLVQQELLTEAQKQLVWLLGDDLKVLAAIESAGLLFDAENAVKYLNECKQRVEQIEKELKEYLRSATFVKQGSN